MATQHKERHMTRRQMLHETPNAQSLRLFACSRRGSAVSQKSWCRRNRLAQAVDEGFRDAKAMPDPKTATSSHDCWLETVQRCGEGRLRLVPRRHPTLEMRMMLRVGESDGVVMVEEKLELFALCSRVSYRLRSPTFRHTDASETERRGFLGRQSSTCCCISCFSVTQSHHRHSSCQRRKSDTEDAQWPVVFDVKSGIPVLHSDATERCVSFDKPVFEQLLRPGPRPRPRGEL